MPLKKMDALLGSAELRSLAVGARRIRALDRLYRAVAPRELAAASRVKAFRTGTLVVTADNAAIAAKLRQMTGRVLEGIRKSAVEVAAIRIEVQVSGAAHDRVPSSQKAVLGPDAVSKFDELARRVPEGQLKSAIANLVKRRKKLS